MKQKEDDLSWPSAFFLAVALVVLAAFAAGPEFWLEVMK